MRSSALVAAVMVALSSAAHAQHTRFTDGLAIGDLAQGGLKAEAYCDRVPELPPLPGDEPPAVRRSFAGEIYGNLIRGGDGELARAAVGHARAHATPGAGCRWDLAASLVASTRGNRGARAEGKLLFPRGGAGAIALFATAQYGDDSLAARELQLDREIAAGLSYTTGNLYPVTVGAVMRLFGDDVTRLDLRARLSGSGVSPFGSALRPDGESPGVVRRLGVLTMLHVLQFPVSIVYEAEETDRFIAGRDWRRYNIAGAYRLSRGRDVWIVLRRTVHGLSRAPRDREWAVHLGKLVF